MNKQAQSKKRSLILGCVKIKMFLRANNVSTNLMSDKVAVNMFARIKYGEELLNPKSKICCDEWLFGKISLGEICYSALNLHKKSKAKKADDLKKRREDYKLFLRSPYWRGVRVEVLKRDGKKCSVCDNTTNLHIHHTTYKNHLNEMEHLEDLIVLCKTCHDKEHGIVNGVSTKIKKPRKPRKERCVRCVRGEGKNKNKVKTTNTFP